MITMDVFEQKKVLDSFEILVDTREQDTRGRINAMPLSVSLSDGLY